MAERAEYHVISHPQTFPRGLAPDYRAVGTTLGRRGQNLFTPQASLTPGRPVHKTAAVFGHAGGRLVVPNTGEPEVAKSHSISFRVQTEIRLEDLKSVTRGTLKQQHTVAFWNSLTLSAVQ